MNSRKDNNRRRLIISAVKSKIVPFMKEEGWLFEKLPEDWDSPELRRSFPLGYARREQGNSMERLDIQVEKRLSGGLRILLALVPKEAQEVPGWNETIPFSAMGAPAYGPGAYLVLNRFLPGWPCGFRMFDPATPERAEKRVEEILETWSEIERWYQDRELGPHLRAVEAL
jgi:hypothetical protein